MLKPSIPIYGFIFSGILSVIIIKIYLNNNKKKKLIQNEAFEYMLKRKNNFYSFIKKENIVNQNIDPIFYNLKEYNQLQTIENNKIEKEWKRRIMFETTPRGNIIMFYDVFKQGFGYYSDQTGIPYHILNLVAMKYTSIFRCIDFYMDKNSFPDKPESPLIKIYYNEEKEKKNPTPTTSYKINTKDAPFMKPKKEQSEPTKPKHTPTLIENILFKIITTVLVWFYPKKTQFSVVEILKEKSKEIPDEKPKEKTINKFIYYGKIANYSILQKTEIKTKNLKTSYENMFLSYKDYKKQIM